MFSVPFFLFFEVILMLFLSGLIRLTNLVTQHEMFRRSLPEPPQKNGTRHSPRIASPIRPDACASPGSQLVKPVVVRMESDRHRRSLPETPRQRCEEEEEEEERRANNSSPPLYDLFSSTAFSFLSIDARASNVRDRCGGGGGTLHTFLSYF